MLCTRTCTIKMPDVHSPMDIDLRNMNIQSRRFCGTVLVYACTVLLDIPKYTINNYSIFLVFFNCASYSVRRTTYGVFGLCTIKYS